MRTNPTTISTHLIRRRKDYKSLKELKICVRCKKAEVMPRRVCCKECAVKNANWSAKYYAKRKNTSASN